MANTAVSLAINFELLGTAPFSLNYLDAADHKVAGTYKHTISTIVFLNDASTLSQDAEVVAQADNTSTTAKLNNIVINGFIGTT